MGLLKRLFGLEPIVKAIEVNGTEISEQLHVLELEKIAIQTAIGYIASAISQCEFRTFVDGAEIRGQEYYRWNYSPNKNQNSSQFIWETVESLIYNGEALIIEERDQLFLADTFTTNENGIKERVFENITVDGETLRNRKGKDVIWMVFDNNDIRPLLSEVCHEYESLIEEAVKGYKQQHAEKGILNIDARLRGNSEDESIRNDLLNNRFKKYFSAESAVLPLHSGYTYTSQQKNTVRTSEVTDVKMLTEEIYNRVGQIFRVPPTLLRGEIGDVDASQKNFLRYAVKPVAKLLETEITRKLYGYDAYTKGSYLTIDTSRLEVTGTFDMAEKVDKLIACGMYSIDEARRKTGEPELGLPETQKHFITKNYAEITQEGGEGNEE